LVLQDNALTWFTQLGRDRHSLQTWSDWQLAIINAFYMPNHRANLRRQCLYRTLDVNESLSDYFSDKKRLQSYVFPNSTPTHDLVEDMIEGIPLTMQPLIKANVSRSTTLEEFRRILIDLEPGLRGRHIPQDASDTSASNYEAIQEEDNTTTFTQYHTVEPSVVLRSSPPGTRPTTGFSTLPRTNCFNCGGDHWKKDCPRLQQSRYDLRGSPTLIKKEIIVDSFDASPDRQASL
jgi:hypothetical protein